jgi:hypothetical protein
MRREGTKLKAGMEECEQEWITGEEHRLVARLYEKRQKQGWKL